MTTAEARPEESPEEQYSRFRERGEVEALGRLFDGVSPTLFRMALALAPDAATAEDAVQETFLTLLGSATQYDPSRPLVPWLVGVLHLKIHEARRRARRLPDPSRLPPPLFPDDPATAAETGEEVDRVRAALDALPEPYRAVAILRWRYGLEPAAIADARGDPPGTVRSLLHRAQEKLRSTLRVLPAFLAGPRPPRGIDSVRAAVLAEGGAVAAAAGAAGTAASTLFLGGALVAQKVLVATVAVVLLTGAGWFAFRSGEPPVVAVPTAPPRAAVPDARPPAPPPPAAPAPVASGDFPPPVDLSACDRDLDLFGTTVDDSGKPVPGALVETVRYPWRKTGMGGKEQAWLEEKGPSARSAVDGTFAIRLSRGEMFDLRATAEGLGQGDLAQCLAGERVALVLRRGGSTVRVTVLDESRKPVANADLRFWMKSPDSMYGRFLLSRVGITDASGRFEFPHLPAGKASVTVNHAVLGQPGWQHPEVPATGILDLEVVLPAGRAISGRINDASTGKPVPGARVGSNWVMDRPVTADAEGRYTFPGWTGKGVSVLTVAAEGYGSVMQKVTEAATLDFAIEPAFRATGRIIAADGSPVAGARVSALGHWKADGRSGRSGTSEETGADGRFTLADLSRRSPYDMVAEAEGHGQVHGSFAAPGGDEAETDLGDIALSVARSIEGRALDPSGNPLPGKDVNIALLKPADDPARKDPQDSGAVAGTGEVRRTDDLGRFRFPDLSPGRWALKLVVRGSLIVETTVALPPDRDVLDVVLAEQGKSISFVVTDPEGRPLTEICVTTDTTYPHPSVAAGASTNLQAWTDSSGRVEFRALPDPPKGWKGISFNIQPIIGETAPPWAMHRTEPLIPAGQEVRVALKPVSWIRGKVLGPADEPIPGLYVRAVGPGGEDIAGALGACNDAGEFAVRVPPGEAVTLRAPGHRSVDSGKGYHDLADTGYTAELPGVTAPASGVFLRATKIASDGALGVLVLDIDGRPVSDFAVFANRTKGGDHRAGRTDASGRLRWEGMREDTWTVVPNLPLPEDLATEIVAPASVEVVPRGQDVVLRFRRGVPVEGVVLRPDGSPAPGARLAQNHRRGGGGGTRPPTAGADGRFRLFLGDGDELMIGAGWSDGAGGLFRGDSDWIRVGQSGPVEIRLEPAKDR